MDVTWLRRGTQRTAHAFREQEVKRFDTAMPLGQCDKFPVGDLVEDRHAARCVVCERAIRRLDLEQRRADLKTAISRQGPTAC